MHDFAFQYASYYFVAAIVSCLHEILNQLSGYLYSRYFLVAWYQLTLSSPSSSVYILACHTPSPPTYQHQSSSDKPLLTVTWTNHPSANSSTTESGLINSYHFHLWFSCSIREPDALSLPRTPSDLQNGTFGDNHHSCPGTLLRSSNEDEECQVSRRTFKANRVSRTGVVHHRSGVCEVDETFWAWVQGPQDGRDKCEWCTTTLQSVLKMVWILWLVHTSCFPLPALAIIS